jgi:hypothetical protein
VVSVGSEATLFVKGIVAGSTITKRLATVFRDAPAKARYAAEALLRPGKPLAVTEFGMRTYDGAASSGALGSARWTTGRCCCTSCPWWTGWCGCG